MFLSIKLSRYQRATAAIDAVHLHHKSEHKRVNSMGRFEKFIRNGFLISSRARAVIRWIVHFGSLHAPPSARHGRLRDLASTLELLCLFRGNLQFC
jgi:hypothetical protein